MSVRVASGKSSTPKQWRCALSALRQRVSANARLYCSASAREPVSACSLCFVAVRATVRSALQATRCLQVAKQLHQQLHQVYKAWFDYSSSGNDSITVVYTKGEPVGMVRAVPPWEAGSQPPPFVVQMQQEAERRQHEREEKERAKAEALRRPVTADDWFRVE